MVGQKGSRIMTTHILLVEDEVKLARFVELELSSEGLSSKCCT
jgi:DNA-binding response OmpR family regulator